MNATGKIIEYGQSLGLTCLSVDDLIDSHKALRSSAMKDQKEWHDALAESRQRAYQQVLDSTWIRIEDLKRMSVSELVALLSDD